MNHTFSLTEFQKHLRVAEPKRGEIVAELKDHLDELDGDATSLGDPERLANQYNRTHIGLFHTRLRLHLLPLIAVTAVLIVHAIQLTLRQRGLLTTYVESNEVVAFEFWLALGIPFGLGFLAGRALIRTHRAVADFLVMIVTSFLFGTLAGVLYNIFAGPEAYYGPYTIGDMFAVSAWLAGLMTIFSLVATSFGLFITAPLYGRPNVKLAQLKAQLWTSALSTFFIAFLTLTGTGVTRSWLTLLIAVPGLIVLVILGRYWIQRWRMARDIERTRRSTT